MSLLIRCFFAACLALNLAFVSFAASVDYTVRNAPGASTADTYLAVRNAIVDAAVHKREVYSSNTTLERRWVDATLLKLGHERTAAEIRAKPLDVSGVIEIVCTECYVKGTAFAELHIDVADPGAYVQQVINNFTDDVQNITAGFTQYIIDYAQDYSEDTTSKIVEGGFDVDHFEMPTFNYTFELDIPEIPDVNLKFKFDGMEIYMNINTILEAAVTYELPLYRSQSPLGLRISDDLQVGVFFTVDLILSVGGQIDISNGFHIKLDDGIAIEIALFGDEVSEITFNGGQFEFLPVTIESGGMVFSSILRLGVHAGFELVPPKVLSLAPPISGGIEVGVFAHVAEFVTNITYTPEEEDCQLNVVQSYQLALGAKAGASIVIDDDTWGPMPETLVPIWYTEMGSACAVQKTATTTPIPTITTAPKDRKRQDLVTTTTTMEFIHTGVNCLHIGLVNCPASLQNTSQSTETRTIVTAIPSGSQLTFPVTVQDAVPSAIAFGRDAMTIPASTGSPVSYIPLPTSTSTSPIEGFADDAKAKFENNKPLILGLSCGLGGALLIAIIAGIIFCSRRRAAQRDFTNRGAYAPPAMVDTPTTPAMSQGYMNYKASKSVNYSEAEVGTPSPH